MVSMVQSLSALIYTPGDLTSLQHLFDSAWATESSTESSIQGISHRVVAKFAVFAYLQSDSTSGILTW